MCGIGILFLLITIGLIVLGISFYEKKKPVYIATLVVLFFVGLTGLLLFIYQKGTYEIKVWNIISASYHYDKPIPMPDFYSAYLMAVNTHSGIGFGFSNQDTDLFRIFTKATGAWQTAFFMDVAAALLFYLSIFVYQYLIRLRKGIMPLMLVVPAAVAVWQAVALAPYTALFVSYTLLPCMAYYLLIAFPFTYYVLNKHIKLKKNTAE
jgi:hypothetical protein